MLRAVAGGALFACLFLIPSALGQVPDDGPTSVGFAAPDSTQPVRVYRLPDWHWSRWTLNGGGDAGWSTSDHGSREQSRFSTGLSVHPRYEGFWESEDRGVSLDAAPDVSVQRSGNSTESDVAPDEEQDRLDYELSLEGSGTLREYVGGRTFVLAEGGGELSYRRENRELQPEGDTETQILSRQNVDVRLGVGVGRVRVVTPVIRALRVRERLRAVGADTRLSDNQVQAAARQLARRPGYEAVYDRPDKPFWRDFFEVAEVPAQTPFETFYVADVLREPVGVRREGAELQVGPLGSYNRRLERQEENGRLQERNFQSNSRIGGFVRGRWYRNVTLNHQLGAELNASYATEDGLNTVVEGQWLWVLADQIRLDTRLWNYLHSPSDSQARVTSQHGFSSDLLIFVENSLSFSAGASLQYSRRGYETGVSRSNFDTSFQFSITYVLSRALR